MYCSWLHKVEELHHSQLTLLAVMFLYVANKQFNMLAFSLIYKKMLLLKAPQREKKSSSMSIVNQNYKGRDSFNFKQDCQTCTI